MKKKRFLAIGYVTKDVLENGEAHGGSALYSALLAKELGFEAHVCTSADEAWLGKLNDKGICFHNHNASSTTTFEHRYAHGSRTSKICEIAPLPTALVQKLLKEMDWDIVLFCPNWNEVQPSDLFLCSENTISAIFPQGWFREKDSESRVIHKRIDWPTLPSSVSLAVTSKEDIVTDPSIWLPMRQSAKYSVLTNGHLDFEVVGDGKIEIVTPPYLGNEVDPTGAGDVFGTFLLFCISENIIFKDAVRLASIAASISVEKKGILGVPSLGDILKRISNSNSKKKLPLAVETIEALDRWKKIEKC